jgi:osmotically-inducible protein OsmY
MPFALLVGGAQPRLEETMTRMTRCIVLGTVMLTLSGCATLSDPLVQFVNDSTTTTEIKTRLAMHVRPGSLTGIGVHTSGDVVRLTGTVASEAERQQVEAIARNVAGDNRVTSELLVAGAPSASPRAQK